MFYCERMIGGFQHGVRTQAFFARALRMLKNKQVPQIWKKHDNIPL
jgi:hypothetical protein